MPAKKRRKNVQFELPVQENVQPNGNENDMVDRMNQLSNDVQLLAGLVMKQQQQTPPSQPLQQPLQPLQPLQQQQQTQVQDITPLNNNPAIIIQHANANNIENPPPAIYNQQQQQQLIPAIPTESLHKSQCSRYWLRGHTSYEHI